MRSRMKDQNTSIEGVDKKQKQGLSENGGSTGGGSRG